MAKLILVTGGARSGKSSWSETLAKASSPERCYIATCPVLDDEMKQRIARHQRNRQSDNWRTVEEPLDLAGAIRAVAYEQPGGVVLIDCLTLWIGNLLFHDESFDEDKMASECGKLLEALKGFSGTCVMVINEVGLGVVPDNALARKFRDCSGRCGQIMAKAADEVYFCVCGIANKIKG